MDVEARTARYARDFVAAHQEFIDLVASLSDEQWQLTGKNFPDRINDEDENRSIGVIAYHVAYGDLLIMERIERMVEGRPLQPLNFHDTNATQAAKYSGVTRDEVLAMLRSNHESIPPRVRAIPDDALEVERETPVGPATVAQRLERTLIGHLKMHQGSIEAAIS